MSTPHHRVGSKAPAFSGARQKKLEKQQKRQALLGVTEAALRKMFKRGRCLRLDREALLLGRVIYHVYLSGFTEQSVNVCDVAGRSTVSEDDVTQGLLAKGISVLGAEPEKLKSMRKKKNPKKVKE